MPFGDDRPFVTLDGNDTSVELKYKQPNVAVNTSARFVTHDTIGDVTIRQKVGEDPDKVSIDGICTVEEANDIDDLKANEVVEVVSNRWSGRAQVASTRTSPHSEGGSQDKDGEWLHTFTIELSEVGQNV